MRLCFIKPGKPIQNAFVESFIGGSGTPEPALFGSLAEAHRVIEARRQHYNRERPHSVLGYEPTERRPR